MKNRRLHIITWAVVRAVMTPYLKLRFNYSFEKCEVEGPCLVMASHDTDWDPLLLGAAFPKQMYFVASEHIFRWGFISFLLRLFIDPISRLKGTTAGDTVLTIMRRLRKGYNVAMFANGSRSFNGISEDILPSTGKLARSSGATLITYRFDGGYFTQPRWSHPGTRRGRIKGYVVGIYKPEELKKMSVDEINAIINRDLHVDAYAVQRADPVAFKGKRRAEYLETVLCRCPHCGELGHMQSEDDRFFCTSCGYALRYDEYGFFRGEEGFDAVYDSVTDWDKAQSEILFEMADSAAEGALIFSDTDFELWHLASDHSSVSLGQGNAALYSDRFECCGKVFPIASISGFAMHGPTAVNFTVGEESFEWKPLGVRCTRKYMLVINHLREKQLLHSEG